MPTDINLLYTEGLSTPKYYSLDFDKFNADTDINSKLNAVMNVFKYLNFRIPDNYVDDEIRKYLKEV